MSLIIRRFSVRVCVAAGSLSMLAGPAFAHSGTGLPGGFAAGFTHPLSGFDHMLAMVAVGLWGAFLGRPLLIALPVIFPAVMALGGAAAMLGAPNPPIELGIALSVLVLGGAIALAYRAPTWAACAIVGVFAVFHGFAHGEELPSAADPLGYSLGFVLATGLLHLTGIGVGALADRSAGRPLVRGVGGAIALSGGYFLWKALVS